MYKTRDTLFVMMSVRVGGEKRLALTDEIISHVYEDILYFDLRIL